MKDAEFSGRWHYDAIQQKKIQTDPFIYPRINRTLLSKPGMKHFRESLDSAGEFVTKVTSCTM
jgi:hypothetical protein